MDFENFWGGSDLLCIDFLKNFFWGGGSGPPGSGGPAEAVGCWQECLIDADKEKYKTFEKGKHTKLLAPHSSTCDHCCLQLPFSTSSSSLYPQLALKH